MTFFRNKRKKNAGLLSKQQPRLRLRYRSSLLRKILMATSIVGVITAIFSSLYSRYVEPKIQTQQTLNNDNQLQITIDSPKHQILSEQEKEHLLHLIPKTIKALPHFSLQLLAQKLLANSTYEEILVMQPARDKLYLKVRQRTPVLITEADHLRYISASGAVYGLVDPAHPTSALPRLDGLFSDPSRHYTLTPANSILVSEFEQLLLREATSLTLLLQEHKLAPRKIEYVLHRGFLCHLEANDLNVTFGRAPFDKKIAKLNKVLAHLTAKGTRAQRIELDYIGKAFIKEKLQ